MRLLRPASHALISFALGVLRIVTGVVFAVHGGQKLFVFGFDGVIAGFTQMGIPLAAVAGPAVALTEFIGGSALILGLLTRPAALGLVGVMTGAIVFAHFPAGFFLPNGYEFALMLLASALTFVIVGGGRLSLDAVIADRALSSGRS
ncbi:MAG: DoxX family protein [Gemmatimonadaceae bacterium]